MKSLSNGKSRNVGMGGEHDSMASPATRNHPRESLHRSTDRPPVVTDENPEAGAKLLLPRTERSPFHHVSHRAVQHCPGVHVNYNRWVGCLSMSQNITLLDNLRGLNLQIVAMDVTNKLLYKMNPEKYRLEDLYSTRHPSELLKIIYRKMP